MSMEIRCSRIDRIFRPNDKVRGTIIVKTDSGFAHSGLTLSLTGVVDLHLSAKAVGLFDAFSNTLKPMTLCDVSLTIEESGKTKTGVNEYPFVFDLIPPEGGELYETYHGVYINITYILKADLKRKYFGSNMKSQLEFIVEQNPLKEYPAPEPLQFTLDAESVDEKHKKKGVPSLRMTGELSQTSIKITDQLWGHFTLEECELPVKSVELQLVRVETVGSAEGFAKEDTEIQNIQVGDGDVAKGLQIPLHMVFPRLYTCPTTIFRIFKIEFQVNIVVMFFDGKIISKKFPVTLLR